VDCYEGLEGEEDGNNTSTNGVSDNKNYSFEVEDNIEVQGNDEDEVGESEDGEYVMEDRDKEGWRNQRVPAGEDSPSGQLLELTFQLSITFSTEQFIDRQPSSSLLVYFSGYSVS
jgi:hypothetical protein